MTLCIAGISSLGYIDAVCSNSSNAINTYETALTLE